MTSASPVYPEGNEVKRIFRCEVQKSFQENFLPLKIYLWVHGIGYWQKPKTPMRKFKMAIAVILAVIITANALYIPYGYDVMFHYAGRTLDRREIAHFVIIILTALLRDVMFIRTRKIHIIVKRLAKIYSTIAPNNRLKLKWKLCLILFVNDAFLIGFIFFMYSRLSPGKFFESLGKYFKYGALQDAQGTVLYYVSFFILHWTLVCPITSVYFSVICYSIKETLDTLRERVTTVGNEEVDSLFYVYNDIANLISTFNESYHTVLMMDLFVVLGITFRELYTLVFTIIKSKYYFGLRIVYVSIAFARLVSICLSASSVTNAAARFRNAFGRKPVEQHNFKRLQLLLIMKYKSVDFTLLNSIIIDSSVILAAVGHMITYGILIATFNINEQLATDK